MTGRRAPTISVHFTNRLNTNITFASQVLISRKTMRNILSPISRSLFLMMLFTQNLTFRKFIYSYRIAFAQRPYGSNTSGLLFWVYMVYFEILYRATNNTELVFQPFCSACCNPHTLILSFLFSCKGHGMIIPCEPSGYKQNGGGESNSILMTGFAIPQPDHQQPATCPPKRYLLLYQNESSSARTLNFSSSPSAMARRLSKAICSLISKKMLSASISSRPR